MIDCNILLFDENANRRAQIVHAHSQHGIHIDPFENLEEIETSPLSGGVLLVHDANGNLGRLFSCLQKLDRWFPVIGYAHHPEPPAVVDAVFAGALDYLAWPFAPQELKSCLQRVSARRASARDLHARAASARVRLSRLSRRERAVVDALVEGSTNKDIGLKLGISPRTVEIHRASAIAKLGVSRSSEVIRIALEATARI